MPTLVVIGGVSRCGKTTLANKVLDRSNQRFDTVRFDEFGDMLRKNLGPINHITHKDWKTPERFTALCRLRDKETFVAALPYINALLDNGRNVLAEGCLWPDYIAQAAFHAKADIKEVYLIPEPITDFAEATKSLRLKDKSDPSGGWLGAYTDTELEDYARANAYRAEEYLRVGQNHPGIVQVGMMEPKGFDRFLDTVLQEVLGYDIEP